MKKIIIILLIIILSILGINIVDKKSYKKLEEEAIPIRDNNHIIGLKYKITIEENINNKNLICRTEIIDSILHYQDIKDITNYKVILDIDNKSNYSYKISNILIKTFNSNEIININYSNYSFILNKKYMDSNKYYILIEFMRDN